MTEGGEAKTLAIECGRCKLSVAGQVSASLTETDDESDYVYIVSLVKCPNCSSPIVGMEVAEPSGGNEWDVAAPRRVWPDPPRSLSWTAPPYVQASFAEAEQCFRIGAFTAAALMARRVLEAIADELGAQGRTLDARLKDLKDSKQIDDRLYEWATALRVVGNSAAHDSHLSVSRADADDVLVFAAALADYVFTFRHRYEQFQNRQKPAAE